MFDEFFNEKFDALESIIQLLEKKVELLMSQLTEQKKYEFFNGLIEESEVARRFGVCKKTLKKNLKAAGFEAKPIGRVRYYHLPDIEDFLKNLFEC